MVANTHLTRQLSNLMEYLKNGLSLFHEMKKFLVALKVYIFRSYSSLVEISLNQFNFTFLVLA